MTCANDTLDRPAEQLSWAEAVTEYEEAKARAKAAGDAHTKAERAANAEIGERDLEAEYGTGVYFGSNRGAILEQLSTRTLIMAARAARDGKPMSDAEIGAAWADIPTLPTHS